MLEETPLDYALVRVFAGNLPYKRAGLGPYVSRSGSSIGSCRRLLPDDGQTRSNPPDPTLASKLPLPIADGMELRPSGGFVTMPDWDKLRQ